jgi:hypothetical protein
MKMIYDPRTAPSSQKLGDVARKYLADLEKRVQTKPRAVMEEWPIVAGEFARLTCAKKFENGTLHVSVKNSAALSILHQQKEALLKALRAKIPETKILNIMFRFG